MNYNELLTSIFILTALCMFYVLYSSTILLLLLLLKTNMFKVT